MTDDERYEVEFATTEERDAFIDEHFPDRRAAGSPPGWYDLPGEGQTPRERANGAGNIGVFIRTVTFYGPAAQKARDILGRRERGSDSRHRG